MDAHWSWSRWPKMTQDVFVLIRENIHTLVGGLEQFFIFPYIGNNHPNWLIFFRGVQTTNQLFFSCISINVLRSMGFQRWLHVHSVQRHAPKVRVEQCDTVPTWINKPCEGFHKWGVPQNRWFIREDPGQMTIGVPQDYGNLHVNPWHRFRRVHQGRTDQRGVGMPQCWKWFNLVICGLWEDT